jgi:cyanophycin synthetase
LNSKIKCGLACEEGIFLNGRNVSKKRSANYEGAIALLFDPLVEIAVLECDEEDTVYSGLGFSECDICIITGNYSVPEIVPDFISTREMLATFANSTSKDGYTILNADDETILGLNKEIKNKTAYYTTDRQNKSVATHIKIGGVAAVFENNHINIYSNNEKVLSIKEIPDINEAGKIMPAMLAAFLLKIDYESILTLSGKLSEV